MANKNRRNLNRVGLKRKRRNRGWFGARKMALAEGRPYPDPELSGASTSTVSRGDMRDEESNYEQDVEKYVEVIEVSTVKQEPMDLPEEVVTPTLNNPFSEDLLRNALIARASTSATNTAFIPENFNSSITLYPSGNREATSNTITLYPSTDINNVQPQVQKSSTCINNTTVKRPVQKVPQTKVNKNTRSSVQKTAISTANKTTPKLTQIIAQPTAVQNSGTKRPISSLELKKRCLQAKRSDHEILLSEIERLKTRVSELTDKIELLVNKKKDHFDEFANYVGSKLRTMSAATASKLEFKLLDLIMCTDLDEQQELETTAAVNNIKILSNSEVSYTDLTTGTE